MVYVTLTSLDYIELLFLFNSSKVRVRWNKQSKLPVRLYLHP